MTREEIHAKVNAEGSISKANVIDFMWEYFQSRTCSVCKFYSDGICKNTENDIVYPGWETAPMPTQRTQLCHKFERKDK